MACRRATSRVGRRVAQPTDTARLEAGSALFDSLYGYCQEMVKRGQANGAFVE